MGALMRVHDWRASGLGPPETWPQSLKTAVRIILTSRYAMFVWWGARLVNLYNDAYRPFLGDKHPASLGRSAKEVWAEIWDLIGPRTEAVMARGEATFDEALLLLMARHGYLEETYFTFSYSPLPDDAGNIGGIFCAVTEETERIIGERRLRLLRELAARLGGSRDLRDFWAVTVDSLGSGTRDLPFALVYQLDDAGEQAELVVRAGLAEDSRACPARLGIDTGGAIWPIDRVIASGEPAMVDDLEGRFGDLGRSIWDRPPSQARITPILQTGQTRPFAVLIVGLNPYRPLDDEYRGFIDLLAGQLASGIGNARAYEDARRRAEALAEIDRAKTQFFSNVSHEFRTPLTLMLGPLEDLLAEAPATLGAGARDKLALAHRNSRRLLKLVNTLLDFSRLEAGRVRASYAATDLAGFTADLASCFRSLVERAGIRFVVDCRPLPEAVYVDRDMWEKVVLNLVSNAFKFTFEGEIEVSVGPLGTEAALLVRDTGVGIPEAEVPHIFERFHRVEATRGRTFEGSGIGLALVQELVKLHGGAVRVQSRRGHGTSFLVTIPVGCAHLPADRVIEAGAAGASPHAAGFVEEAMRWLPDGATAGLDDLPLFGSALSAPSALPTVARPRVLVVDDNADMREYIRELLSDRYLVDLSGDGEAALAAIRRHRPDVVLTDVMMPTLDGFGLLRAIRGDPDLRELPVIVLSARAGEDASVDGLQAGADDYLVKPFGARELVARVDATVRMARLRGEAAAREVQLRLEAAVAHAKLEAVLQQMPGAAVIAEVPSGRLVLANGQVEAILGHPLVRVDCIADYVAYRGFHADGRPYRAEEYPLARAVAHDEVVAAEEIRYRHGDGREIVLLANAGPIKDATGRSIAAIATWTDVTPLKAAESQLRHANETLEQKVEERTAAVRAAMNQLAESERQLRLIFQAVTDYALFTLDQNGVVASWNQGAERIKGFQPDEIIGQHFSRFYPEEERARGAPELALATAADEGRFEAEGWRVRKDGSQFWANVVIDVVRDETGALIGFVKITRDLTERRFKDEQLRQSQKMEALGQLTGGVAHDFNNVLTTILPSLEMARDHIDNDTALKYVGHAIHAATRGARLAHQLLSFSHKQDLITRPVDVNELVGVLCEMLPRTIGPTIEIKTDLDHRLWLAMSEPSQLELAILNLAINARDAMSLGGTLTIATANVSADSRAMPPELERQDYVLISVADTGIGMTQETRLRAFEPFFTTKARDRGTGLGLSMVYALTRDSGGAVTIASEVGKGTTVSMFLPRARLTTRLTDRSQSVTALDTGPPSRLLVVDDDSDVREVLAMMLRGFGHEVIEADGGAMALDILQTDRRFDAMIVDLAMPNMHGAVFAVRARSLVPEIPALFVTGYTDPHWLRDISPEQMLKKPFARLDLASKLRDLLAGRRAGDQSARLSILDRRPT